MIAEISGGLHSLPARSDTHVSASGTLNLVGNLFYFLGDFVVATTHESLDRINGIFGIGDRLTLGNLPDEPVPIFRKGDD